MQGVLLDPLSQLWLMEDFCGHNDKVTGAREQIFFVSSNGSLYILNVKKMNFDLLKKFHILPYNTGHRKSIHRNYLQVIGNWQVLSFVESNAE